MSGLVLQVGFVCEGPTDYPILAAVVDAVLLHTGYDWVPRHIQPERDEQTRSWTTQGGCGEVRKWCESMKGQMDGFLISYSLDLLIIHMDADRCAANGVSDPAGLCAAIHGWLGRLRREHMHRLIIVLPSQASESWLYAACVPDRANAQLEQHPQPAQLLADAKRIERDHNGRPRKDLRIYERLSPTLQKQAATLRTRLPELGRFMDKLERFRHTMGPI